MSDEARARELRLELEKLAKAEGTLEGLALVDAAEQARLGQVREAIRERGVRLAELATKARR
jgi:hypothetical protein